MADVITNARELKKRAEARVNKQRALDDVVRARKAQETFEQARLETAALAEFAAAMRQAQIVTADLSEYRARTKTIATRLQTALPDAPTPELQDLANTSERELSDLRSRVRQQLAVALGDWLEHRPQPSETFLRVLEAAAPDEVRATRTSLSSLHELADPQNANEVRALSKAAEALDENYQDLVAKTPQAVGDFLERAPTGVPLQEVSEDVLNWLRDHEADAAFVVRLSR